MFGGVCLVLLAAVAFGFMGLLRQWAVDGGMSTYLMLTARFSIAAVVLGFLVFVQRLGLPKGGILIGLIAMGAIGYFGEAMCFFLAMEHLPSGMVSLLLYLNPVLVTLGARVLFGERITPARIGALALAIGGMGMLLYTPDMARLARDSTGIVLGLSTAVIYAGYLLAAGRVAAKTGPLQSTLVITASAAVMFGAVLLYRFINHQESVPAFTLAWKGPWQAATYFAIFCTVVPIMALLAGISMIGSVRASVIAIAEPLTTVIVGVMLLGETISGVQKIGGGLIVAAAALSAIGGGAGEGKGKGSKRSRAGPA